eukprot:UN03073
MFNICGLRSLVFGVYLQLAAATFHSYPSLMEIPRIIVVIPSSN